MFFGAQNGRKPRVETGAQLQEIISPVRMQERASRAYIELPSSKNAGLPEWVELAPLLLNVVTPAPGVVLVPLFQITVEPGEGTPETPLSQTTILPERVQF